MTDFIDQALLRLSRAALDQGEAPYDHSAALEAARIEERGERLMPIARRWARVLPNGRRTLGDWINLDAPTGAEASRVFVAALEA